MAINILPQDYLYILNSYFLNEPVEEFTEEFFQTVQPLLPGILKSNIDRLLSYIDDPSSQPDVGQAMSSSLSLSQINLLKTKLINLKNAIELSSIDGLTKSDIQAQLLAISEFTTITAEDTDALKDLVIQQSSETLILQKLMANRYAYVPPIIMDPTYIEANQIIDNLLSTIETNANSTTAFTSSEIEQYIKSQIPGGFSSLTPALQNLLNPLFAAVSSQAATSLSQTFNNQLSSLPTGLSIAASVIGTLTETQLKSEFVNLISQQATISQSTQHLSPNEIKKRDIMMETYDILLKMMNTMQRTVGLLTQNLIFYAKYQDEYTTAMTKVPIYAAGSMPPTYIDDDNDPITTVNESTNEINFGFGNITLRNLIEYMASLDSSKLNHPPSSSNQIMMGQAAWVDFSDDDYVIDQPWPIPDTTYDSPATPSRYTFTIRYDYQTNTIRAFIWRTGNNAGEVIGVTVTSAEINQLLPAGVSLGDASYAIRAQVWSLLEQKIKTYPNNQFIRQLQDSYIGVAWRYQEQMHDHDDNDDTPNVDKNAAARGEANQLNQQYIENLRSLRQGIQDISKRQESQLTNAKDAVNEVLNMLKSFIESMSGLLAAVYK